MNKYSYIQRNIILPSGSSPWISIPHYPELLQTSLLQEEHQLKIWPILTKVVSQRGQNTTCHLYARSLSVSVTSRFLWQYPSMAQIVAHCSRWHTLTHVPSHSYAHSLSQTHTLAHSVGPQQGPPKLRHRHCTLQTNITL